jgi:hypothetical protein
MQYKAVVVIVVWYMQNGLGEDQLMGFSLPPLKCWPLIHSFIHSSSQSVSLSVCLSVCLQNTLLVNSQCFTYL